jgi:hypothetical protein
VLPIMKQGFARGEIMGAGRWVSCLVLLGRERGDGRGEQVPERAVLRSVSRAIMEGGCILNDWLRF